MGIGGIWQWVVILAIVMLLFGTKKLRNMGSDLGHAIKGFRKGMTADRDSDAVATEETALKQEPTTQSTAGAPGATEAKAAGTEAK